MPEEEKNQALKFAIKLLMLRRRSVAEMRERLRKKGFADALVAETMAELNRFRYLDDAAFAESFVNDRLNFRPAGRFLIAQELKARGIPEAVSAAVLDEKLSPETELRLARDLAQKKSKLIRAKDPRQAAVRLRSYLQGKGFGAATISQVMRSNIGSEQELNPEDF